MADSLMIPAQLPVMTLAEVVFFPHITVPLYLFEQRYQQMLDDTLDSERIFVLACRDPQQSAFPDCEDSPHPVATAGIIRSCKRNPDGTANLMLQGLARVLIKSMVPESPYPLADLETLNSKSGAEDAELDDQRSTTERLILENLQGNNMDTHQIIDTLNQMQDPEVFLDCAASILCQDVSTKQQLLEEFNVNLRFHKFIQYLEEEHDLLC